jgi:uncharacterized protein (TIGR03083 family)
MTTDWAEPTYDEIHSALRRSRDLLVAAVSPLSGEQLASPSYDDGWSIAQVLSHLGSGAEIFSLFIDAGQHALPVPGAEVMQPIWDRWNAKSSLDQARDALAADAALLDQLSGMSTPDVDRWRLSLFGDEKSLAELLRLRLGEHALHSWDVLVALDSTATVAADAVDLLIDTLPGLAGRVAKPALPSRRINVTTHGPDRSFLLEIDADKAALAPTDPSPATNDDVLRLPAEAFIRLVYGRLDPEHTPPTERDDVDLDGLRRAFPGV